MNIEDVLTEDHFSSGGKERWLPHIRSQFSLPYIHHLQEFLRLEREAGACDRNCSIYPEPDRVFQALELTSPCSVKVVILGQDPYPDGQADGLAFSMCNPVNARYFEISSLGKIFEAVNYDLNTDIPVNGSVYSLQSWADQGVLLLNCALTVRNKVPKSHFCHGWEKFTDKIINAIISDQEHVVFLLWGKEAGKKIDKRTEENIKKRHLVLRAPHPVARGGRFVQAKHFSSANRYLSCHDKENIDWLSVISRS